MSRFRSKPVEIEATQWFKNGDHPQDNCEVIVPASYGEPGEPFLSEGEVVRYFRHPEVSGSHSCPHCGKTMHDHGWIDTVQGGHDVCPGDWIITEPSGNGYYPCKPDVFALKYEAI